MNMYFQYIFFLLGRSDQDFDKSMKDDSGQRYDER